MKTLLSETWLILRNDCRLLWREFRAGKLGAYVSLALVGLGLAGFQALLLVAFFALRRPPPLIIETVVWLFFGFTMLGAAMNIAIKVLFERADFDLLLSSPVSPRAILLARLAGTTAGAAGAALFFALPAINAMAIAVSPRYAFGYVTWSAMALICACAGIALALGLVRALGARRARIWTQVLAAVLGATVYLFLQLGRVFPKEASQSIRQFGARVAEHPAVAAPARASRGEAAAIIALLATATVAAFLTTRLLGRLFVHGVQESGENPARKRRSRSFRFRDGLMRATFWKDLRLILRDPLLLTRILPTIAYLLPTLIPISKAGGAGLAAGLAALAVMTTSLLSAQLTLVASAGEEGWDLIRLSGAPITRIRLAKMAAGAAAPLAFALILTSIIAALGNVALAAFTMATALACASGSCWVETAFIQPTPRKDILTTRRSGGPSVIRTVFSIAFLLGGIGAVTLAANHHWLLAAFAFLVVVLGCIACFTLVKMQAIDFEAERSPAKA